MKLKKLVIKAPFAHFGEPYGSKQQLTYNHPPPSTVLGILRVIFGEDINNFVFGYTFKYDAKVKDSITIHKLKFGKKKSIGSDCCRRDYLYNCELTIYTSIDADIKMNYILTLGKSGNLARLELPIANTELKEKTGIAYNQFSPINIGTGVIKRYSMNSVYSKKLQSFDSLSKNLRFNTELKYNKNYDEDDEQNILLWKFKDGEVSFCD